MQYARALMANKIGRLLTRSEHVHHINGDKMDDRIENLQILSPSEHGRLHCPPGIKIGEHV